MKKTISGFHEFDVVSIVNRVEAIFGIVLFEEVYDDSVDDSERVVLLIRDYEGWFFANYENLSDFSINTVGHLYEDEHKELRIEVNEILKKLHEV